MLTSAFIMGLGWLEALIVVVVVVIFANKLGKRRGAGRAFLTGLVVVMIPILLLVGLTGMFFIGSSRQEVRHDEPAVTTVGPGLNGGSIQYEDPITLESQRVGVVVATPVDNDTQVVDPSLQSSGVTVAGTPWTDAVEKHQDFEANEYPSMEAAAEALGRRVGQRLIESEAYGDSVPAIYVWHDGASYLDKKDARNLLEAAASGIRQKLDDPSLVTVDDSRSAEGVRVGLAVQEIHFNNHNRWRKQAESKSGAIALRVQGPKGGFSTSTKFVGAPWIVDRAGFDKRYPGGDWLVAYSSTDHTQHQQAKEDALMSATDALLPMARARISRMSESDQHRFNQMMAKDPDWLRTRVADELVSRNHVADRFAQRFDRPYGSVWREAVLVDANQGHVEDIARSLVKSLDSRVTQMRSTTFSFVGLGGLIFGTYLFLNLATKGYYTWMLRFAALVGLAGVAGFFLFLA